MCDKRCDEATSQKCCRNCALFGGCRKVKCPYCGYESPAEPMSIRWLKQIFGKDRTQDKTLVVLDQPASSSPESGGCHRARTQADRGVGRLSDARPGAAGAVAYLTTHDSREVQKMMAMGLLPGADIKLIRRFPSYVFQVGYSQFTVDRPLAEAVVVNWGDEPAAASGSR